MKRKAFSKNLIKYREMAELTQEQLAEKISVSRNFISNMERGMKIPSFETYVKIVNALNISSDILLADDIDNAYVAKSSLLQERIERLPAEDKRRIFTRPRLADTLF